MSAMSTSRISEYRASDSSTPNFAYEFLKERWWALCYPRIYEIFNGKFGQNKLQNIKNVSTFNLSDMDEEAE